MVGISDPCRPPRSSVAPSLFGPTGRNDRAVSVRSSRPSFCSPRRRTAPPFRSRSSRLLRTAAASNARQASAAATHLGRERARPRACGRSVKSSASPRCWRRRRCSHLHRARRNRRYGSRDRRRYHAIDRFAAFIAEASRRFDVPIPWIRAVMHVESIGDVRARSPKGAMGLMQIMPETYATLRARYALGANPYDPRDNILAGAAFLRELHDRYGTPGFLAAYNAGPARYEEHLRTGRPLPLETQRYVAMLAPIVGGGQMDDRPVVVADVGAWLHSLLFPAQSGRQAGRR